MGMNDNTEDYITLLEIWDRKDSRTDEVLAAFHKDAALFGRAIWWALATPGGWGNYMSPKEAHQLIRALEQYSARVKPKERKPFRDRWIANRLQNTGASSGR